MLLDDAGSFRRHPKVGHLHSDSNEACDQRIQNIRVDLVRLRDFKLPGH